MGNAGRLRQELSMRSHELASSKKLLHELSDAATPSVVFGMDENGEHGNFHPASYRRICHNPEWAQRLQKVHTASRRMMLRSDWRWRELDCANSSDALLMNIFCHPGTCRHGHVATLLGIDSNAIPKFGYKPRLPLYGGRKDSTEIDMKLGYLLVEAKLTETGLQRAAPSLYQRYCDLEVVFDPAELPIADGVLQGYQFVRGVLAAHHHNVSFCLMCDARRPELQHLWYSVLRAVRSADLRARLKVLTWQELSSALPKTLQTFLRMKYGISYQTKS